jgi:type VI secretion system protein ImpC
MTNVLDRLDQKTLHGLYDLPELFCRDEEGYDKEACNPLTSLMGALKDTDKNNLNVGNFEHNIDALIEMIDTEISNSISVVRENESFKTLEGRYLGLQKVFEHWKDCGLQQNFYMDVLSAKDEEITADLDGAEDKESTHLYQCYWNKGLGILGGRPYVALFCDYEFNLVDDKYEKILNGLAELGEHAYMPIIGGMSPSMFGVTDVFQFSALNVNALDNIYNDSARKAYRDLRQSERSRFVALVGPRVFSRKPLSQETLSSDEEGRIISLPSSSGVFPIAAQLISSLNISEGDWPHNITTSGGVSVKKFNPLPLLKDGMKRYESGPAQISLPHEICEILANMGITPLQNHIQGEGLFIPFFPSLYKVEDGGNTIQEDMASTFIVSRVAHELMIRARNWIGSSKDGRALKKEIDLIIGNYRTEDADLYHAKPLKEQSTVEVIGEAGSYKLEFHLIPHSKLKSIAFDFKLESQPNSTAGE